MTYDSDTGLTLLFGGRNDDESGLGDTWAWNGEQWTQIELNGPAGRTGVRMVYDPDKHSSLLFGGGGASDLRADTWQFEAELPSQGDVDCDCRGTAFDIEPFMIALFDPKRYVTLFPDCDIQLADVNQDGEVNGFDIEPFIELLFGP